MNVIFTRGAYLPELNLWLDSRARRSAGYISHGHADHVARHQRPILSSATLGLLQDLLKDSNPCILECGEPYQTPEYILTLYPAGHCLGSTQILIQSKSTGERLLYTGDFKVRHNPTAEPLEEVACDTLIVETTYGRSDYIFPPQEEVLERFLETIRAWLDQESIPVVLAYRVGKAQELLYYLLTAGFEVALEESVYVIAQRYQEMGVQFPGRFRPFNGKVREGEVLLYPPGRRSLATVDGFPGRRLIAMSGWALHRDSKYTSNVDKALPFSDHADFSELVAYVKRINPHQVYTVNGFPQLASHLMSLGYQALHLKDGEANRQLRLL